MAKLVIFVCYYGLASVVSRLEAGEKTPKENDRRQKKGNCRHNSTSI